MTPVELVFFSLGCCSVGFSILFIVFATLTLHRGPDHDHGCECMVRGCHRTAMPGLRVCLWCRNVRTERSTGLQSFRDAS